MTERVTMFMLEDEPYKTAAVDASMLQNRVLAAAGITKDDGDGHVAARATANALIVVVMEYLERTSNEHDVELFFEVNGRQPDEIEFWPINILAGLKMRQIKPDDLRVIYDQVVQTAKNYVSSSSPLAWG
jgi:hypothetical protein